MAKAYSVDLREKVLEAMERGMKQQEAAQTFGVSTGSIKRWRKLKRLTGSLEPRKRTDESFESKRGIPNTKLEEFKQFVLANNELTQDEIAAAWGISSSAAGRYVQKANITRKKRLIATKSVQKRQERNGNKKQE